MGSTSAQKDINEIVGMIRRNPDFQVVKSGKHYKVMYATGSKKGRVVTDDDGPVIISGSASDVRARDMHVHRLMKAGVLKSDPWKPKQQKETGEKRSSSERMRSVEMQRLKVEAIQRISKERVERTRELRSRLEPIIVKLGGWGTKAHNSGVAVTELGLIGMHFGRIHNRVEVWKTESAARGSAQSLKAGGAMRDDAYSMWTLVVDWLERQAKQGDEHLRKAWFDTLRAAKGIPGDTQALPAPMQAREDGEPEEEPKEKPKEKPESLVHLVAHDSGREWAARVTLEDFADMQRTLGALEILSHLGHVTQETVSRFETVTAKIGRDRLKVES